MIETRPDCGAETVCEPRAWKLLLPWAVLPLALAIITAVDWLRRARRPTPRKEAS